MIGLPFNDLTCLGWATQVIIEMVAQPEPAFRELAARHPTPEAIQAFIRALPQRDDLGDPADGPRLDECVPAQRMNLLSPEPNCFERAALYVLLAELVDPTPTRQLATVQLDGGGLHTFPLVNGVPVLLHPDENPHDLEQAVRDTREALAVPEPHDARNAMPEPMPIDPYATADYDDHAPCVALRPTSAGPMPIGARDAVSLVTQLGVEGAAHVRNGIELGRAHRAHEVIMALVDQGIAPETQHEVELVAWLLAQAESEAAAHPDPRVFAIVQAVTDAMTDLCYQALAQLHATAPRNLSLNLGGLRISPAPLLTDIAQVAGRVGVNVGAAVARAKLASMGVGEDVFGYLEEELNRDGYSLGALARPRALPSLTSHFDAPSPTWQSDT